MLPSTNQIVDSILKDHGVEETDQEQVDAPGRVSDDPFLQNRGINVIDRIW